jgi:hypothetical protein
MRKVLSIVVLLSLLFMIGCTAHTHIVGNGAQGKGSSQQRQWYVLWGLVPINDVQTSQMAGGATDYTIKTEQSALDVIINIFTGLVTVYSRTVTVEE